MLKKWLGSYFGTFICGILLGFSMLSAPSFADCSDPPQLVQKIQQNIGSFSQRTPNSRMVASNTVSSTANGGTASSASAPASNASVSNGAAANASVSKASVANAPVANAPVVNAPGSTAPATASGTSSPTTSATKASVPNATASSAPAPAGTPTQNAQPAQPNAQPAAETGEPIGQVVWVNGKVKVIMSDKNKTERPLERRSPIYVHDTIVTDKSSAGQIVFTDNSMVSLVANTVFRVDEYAYGKNVPAEKAKYVATLVKGGFRTITGFIPKQNHENYRVKTPVATIAVQGTEYQISYTIRLVVGWISGSPTVTSGGQTVILSAKMQFSAVPSVNAPPQQLTTKPVEFSKVIQMVPSHFEPQQMNMNNVPQGSAGAAAGAAAGSTPPSNPPSGGPPSGGSTPTPTTNQGGGPPSSGGSTGGGGETGGGTIGGGGKGNANPAGPIRNNSFCIQ